MTAADETKTSDRMRTGIDGLDAVLGGGLPRGRMYLINGDPGTGKTTLALQFLLAGVATGESGVYVTLSETESELRAVARSHDWSLDGITVVDLQSAEQTLQADSQYTLFHPSDIELSETTKSVLETVDRIQPARVIFDSLSEMRLLARDSLRYRRQILALKHYFSGRGATVLVLDTGHDATQEFAIESLAHGVVTLQQLAPVYGGQRRRLRIQKVRGIDFHNGFHDFTIEPGGIVVYPRLVPGEPNPELVPVPVKSGSAELDALTGGGIERGTSTLLLGPSGVGKSTVATLYVEQAAKRGERSAVYLFDESIMSWRVRSEALGMKVTDHVSAGRIGVRQVNPAELAPGQFARLVLEAVERDGARLVVIDSLNGYEKAMPEERYLGLHLHELLAFLNQRGVATILVMAQHGILGETLRSEHDVSYIADTVVLMRYFEAFGEVKQAISVVKKRTGAHEHTVRELRLGRQGVHVGERLSAFSGVLTGDLVYTGSTQPLLGDDDARRSR